MACLKGGGIFYAFDDGGEGENAFIKGNSAEAAFFGVVGQLALM